MNKTNYEKQKFIPGETYVPVTGKVFDNEEVDNAIIAAKDEWWTEGHFALDFEAEFRNFMGIRYVSLVNSGSSANLLAVSSLTSAVFKDRALKRGDEFITTAVGFPTTINPALIYGLKPVFIDVSLDTLNIDAAQIEKAITPKTKLIMIAHTLGRTFDLDEVMRVAKKYKLWVIEDCCDALGSRWNGKLAGTFGDIATYSFYPAHQMTMGEGGAVITNNPLIYRANRQFRDWGRDCWCATGKDNTCMKRFQWKLGDLPKGYDHKYIYSQIGFNLKLTDFQAAIGLAQIKKLPFFIKRRQENHAKLLKFFTKYEKYFILPVPTEKESACWFGFTLVVKPGAPFTRNQLTEYLEAHKIGTRNVFAGNLLRHPAYINIKKRVIGKMKNADLVMTNGFWVGIFPGLDDQRLGYVMKTVDEFMSKL